MEKWDVRKPQKYHPSRGGIYNLVFSTTKPLGWYWSNRTFSYGPYRTYDDCAEAVYVKPKKTQMDRQYEAKQTKYWNQVEQWVLWNKRISIENEIRHRCSEFELQDGPEPKQLIQWMPKRIWKTKLPKGVEYDPETDCFILSGKRILPPLNKLRQHCPGVKETVAEMTNDKGE